MKKATHERVKEVASNRVNHALRNMRLIGTQAQQLTLEERARIIKALTFGVTELQLFFKDIDAQTRPTSFTLGDN